MKQREIKFRAWHNYEERWFYFGLFDDAPESIKWIGQFTGLKDKNGNDIFEGDILRAKKGILYEIFFATSTACFIGQTRNKWVKRNNPRPNLYQKIDWIIARDGEIVGNKFENPELLP